MRRSWRRDRSGLEDHDLVGATVEGERHRRDLLRDRQEHGSPNEVVHGVPSSQVPVTEVEPSFVTVAVQIPLSEVAEPTSVG